MINVQNIISVVSSLFRHIYVIVLKLKEGKQPKSPGSYRNDELLTYANAKHLTESQPYIALAITSGSFKSEVLVLGDGKNTTYSNRRKRRATTSDFFNGPLEGDTSYSISLRVFVDDKVFFKFVSIFFYN